MNTERDPFHEAMAIETFEKTGNNNGRASAVMTNRQSNEKRNVTFDTNILIAWILSKKEGSIYRVAVTKAVTDDRLMLTDIIWDECLGFADKKSGKKANVSKADIAAKLKGLGLKVIPIKPIPTDDELKARGYRIRDNKDLKILYSVNMTESVILVTRDDDFDGNVKGITAKIMDPMNYFHEDRTERT